MPIDDVWLSGESVAEAASQRIHLSGQVAPGPTPARSGTQSLAPRNGSRENRPATRDQGGTHDQSGTRGQSSQDAHVEPDNDAAAGDAHIGDTNGRGATQAKTDRPVQPAPVGSSTPPAFDPTSFDPGPDLPPLPTLAPLPTIRPLSQWRAREPVPVPAAVAAPSSEPDPVPDLVPVPDGDGPVPDGDGDGPVPDGDGDGDGTIRVAAVLPDGANPGGIAGGPVTPEGPITQSGPSRRRRRAVEELDGVSEPMSNESNDSTATTRVSSQPPTPPAPHRRRRVLVVGGSGVVGSAVAAALAAQGARVAVHHATRAAQAGELAAALPGQGHLAIGADLSDADDVAALIHAVATSFDGLDVVINAASAGPSATRTPVIGSSPASWTNAWTNSLTIDILGAATVAHAAAAAFVARGRGGRIILLAAKGRPFDEGRDSVRIATEQAVGALGSALAEELAPYGIGVIVVGSGSAAASGWSPAALADTVAWLASGPAAALPGAVFNIAG